MIPAGPELLALAQLVLVPALPVVGLLWRISTQLAALNATMSAHAARIARLEAREG